MATDLEQRIYALITQHDGVWLLNNSVLRPETDIDADLRLDEDEALALMEDFFAIFTVDRGGFAITTYYSPDPSLSQMLNPFVKPEASVVPDFTIGMLIESARAGRWLYD
ncbi:DUF1493 family protein [Erwiniaceae bacterium BAC15a-03b]|uniref:DUF1493 family protein n=1 Tax=Winslowiella arboricola TaxID=2978220 RepID=A0A9J6PSP8_9GAMM|nr:DUF1493 family protein [Winslowiella arboricola]MCU5775706.1 DUF1493 family protein [Winslowiella arboricola]MCU5779443.1 DUF1493 family protein [Winslowiella arboricola]